MHVIFATYLQNVTTLRWKMANNVRVLQITGVKHCDKHVDHSVSIQQICGNFPARPSQNFMKFALYVA